MARRQSIVDLIRREKGKWKIVALTAHSNAVDLARLAREFSAEVAVVGDESCLPALRDALAGSGIEDDGLVRRERAAGAVHLRAVRRLTVLLWIGLAAIFGPALAPYA